MNELFLRLTLDHLTFFFFDFLISVVDWVVYGLLSSWLILLRLTILLIFVHFINVVRVVCHETVRLVSKRDLSTVDLDLAPPGFFLAFLDGLIKVVNWQVVHSIELQESFCCVLVAL